MEQVVNKKMDDITAMLSDVVKTIESIKEKTLENVTAKEDTSTTKKQSVQTEISQLFPQTKGKIPSTSLNRKKYGCTSKNPFVKDTWTREFCCVPYTFSSDTPSVDLLGVLTEAGLGRKKICFDQKDDHYTTIKKIEDAYPRLNTAGGFTLFKATDGGSKRPLKKIEVDWYHVKQLKKKKNSGGGILYIRPLQANLDLSTIKNDETVDSGFVEDKAGPRIKCLICNNLYRSKKILTHQLRCRPATMFSSSSSSSESEILDEYKPEPACKKKKKNVDSVFEEKDSVKTICDMFPDDDQGFVSELLKKNSYNVQGTVDDILLAKSPFMKCSEQSTSVACSSSSSLDNTVQVANIDEAIELLSARLFHSTKSIDINPESVFTDIMAYYKSSTFDPKYRVKVRYVGQPAADTGGVLRQCYTDTFEFFVDNWFTGAVDTKIPIYRSDIYVTKVFVILGTMISHSICQEGPGLPIFPLSVFKYLVTGNINEAIQYLTIDDMGNMQKWNYVKKIRSCSDNEELKELSVDPEFLNVLCECGEVSLLNDDTKESIMQSILIDDVFGKRTILYNQMREGLKTLGFLEMLKRSPEAFIQFFVLKEKKYFSIESFDVCGKNGNIAAYFKRFIAEATPGLLDALGVFSTGESSPPPLHKVKVVFDEISEEFYASTCERTITIPLKYTNQSYAVFKLSFASVIGKDKNAFNTV